MSKKIYSSGGVLLLLLLSFFSSFAQTNLVLNGTFGTPGSPSSANWNGSACAANITEVNPATSYGGSNNDPVLEVDAASCATQDVCVLPGLSYTFSFVASRRTNGAPNPVNMIVNVSGLNASGTVIVTNLVNQTIIRNNTTFNLTAESFSFSVTNTNVKRVRIQLTAGNTNVTTLGMIVDNVALAAADPVINTPATACQNTAVTLSASGAGTAPVYNWSFGSGANPLTATAASNSVSWNTAGIKPVQCIFDNGTCTVYTKSSTVTVNPTPAITAGTVSPVCQGATTFGIPYSNATNNPNQYSLTSTNLPGFTAISNNSLPASPISVTLPAATAAGTYNFVLTVSNAATGCIADNIPLSLTVNPTPTVSAPANATYCNGAIVPAQTLTGSPSGATYDISGGAGIGLANQTGVSQIPSFTATNTGSTVITATITLTPKANNCTGTPQTFTITVNPTPSGTAPAGATYCNGAAVAAQTLTGTPSGVTYDISGGAGIGLPNLTGVSQIPSFTATNSGNTAISATITLVPKAGNCTGTAKTFTITINPAPSVTPPANASYCNGITVPAQILTGSPSGVTYDISGGAGIGLPNQTAANELPSFTAVNAGNTAVTATITLTPQANNCTGTPQTFSITVNPTPAVTLLANASYCNGISVPAQNLTGSPSGVTYDISGGVGTGLANQTGVSGIPSFTATNTGNTVITETITIVPKANGCIGSPQTFTLTVNPTPAVTAPANASYCNGITVPVQTLTGSPSGVTYDISGGAGIGLANQTGVSELPSFTATNTGNTVITGTITVTPKANGCTGTPQTFILTVNPTPAVTPPANASYCNGITVPAQTLSGSPSGITYDISGGAGIGLANQTGVSEIPSFAATNTSNTVITDTITVTPKANGCTGSSQTFTVTVNPTPSVALQANTSYCNGITVPAQTLSGSPSGVTYDIGGGTGIGLANQTGVSEIPSFTATNTGNTVITDTITVTPKANGCTGAPQTFTITVNPTPSLTVPANASYCSGALVPAQVVNGAPAAMTFAISGGNAIGLPSQAGISQIPSFTAINNGTAPETATITLTPSAYNCSGTAVTFTITVNPKALAADITATDTTICSGAAATLSAGSATVVNPVFHWYSNAALTNLLSNTSTYTTPALTADTVYYVTVEGDNKCANTSGDARTVMVHVNPLTAAGLPVASPNPICDGQSSIIMINATGTGLSYQWRKGGTDISGATAANYVINNATAADQGVYNVSITGACGTIISDTVTLLVNTAVTVNTQPGNQTACENGNAAFTVNAGGNNLSYQWQVNQGINWNNISNGGVYSGATSASLNITGAPATMNNYRYRVEIRSGSGTGTCPNSLIRSEVDTLKVNTAVTLSSQPENRTACSGSTAEFTVSATGNNLQYQWQFSPDNGATWSAVVNSADYSNAQTATLTINNTPVTFNEYLYRAVVSSGDGSCAGSSKNSDSALLEVNTSGALNINSNPSDTTVCAGSNTSFSISVSGTNLVYTWRYRTGNSGAWISINNGTDADGTLYAGAQTDTLSLTNVTASKDEYQYECLVTSGAGPGACGSNTTPPATLKVNSTVSIVAQPANTVICQDEDAVLLPSVNGNNLFFQWQENRGNGWGNTVDTGLYFGSDFPFLVLSTVPPSYNGYQYRMVITSGNGSCGTDTTTAAILTVNQDPVIIQQPSATVSTLCPGGNTTLLVSATGSGLNYQWRKGQVPIGGATDTFLVLNNVTTTDAGNYDVVIKGTCDSVTSSTINILVNPTPVFTAEVTNVLCNGAGNGKIILNPVSNPPDDYNYSIDNGATWQQVNHIFENLAPGNYIARIEEVATGCFSDTLHLTLTEPAVLTLIDTATDLGCNHDNSGAISLNPTGGTAPYTYLWNDNTGIQNRSGLAAGTYSVSITDANGCIAADTMILTQPDTITYAAALTQISCYGGSNGTVNITPAGGTQPYTYNWTGANGFSAGTEDLTGLSAGTYRLILTDTHNCIFADSVTLLQPAVLAAAHLQVNVSCNGGSNGSIDLSVTGGTTPYAYLWNDGTATEDRNNLIAGAYTVAITDANSCSATDTITISQPPVLALTLDPAQLLCNSVANGSVNLTVSGGTQPYTYNWTGSNGFTANIQNIANLAAGTYHITVTDSNGCTIQDSTSLTEPAMLTASTAAVNIDCKGNSSGSVNLTIAGGTAPYTFAWTGQGGYTAGTEDISNLAAGSYQVTVTDAKGCIQTAGATLTEPDQLLVSHTATNILCSGAANGSISLNVSGGTTPYTYLWNDGNTDGNRTGLTAGNYTLTLTDAHNCTTQDTVLINQPAVLAVTHTLTGVSCNGGNDGTITLAVTGGMVPYVYLWNDGDMTGDRTGLAAGTYTLTLTDANGCTGADTAPVSEPSALALTALLTPVSCHGGNNGAVDLSVSGGTAPYIYSWMGAGTTASTEDITGLAAGNYSVTVTDAKGCMAAYNTAVTQPALLAATHTTTDVTCHNGNNGAANITVTGGSIPYTYLWNDGTATEDRSNLAAGTYTVAITDANSCTAFDTMTVNQPDSIESDHFQLDISCHGSADGLAFLFVSGGTAPYTYLWNDGDTTEDRSNLAAGTYTVTITDAGNCTIADTLVLTEPPVLSHTRTASNITCHGSNNGSINITVAGGTPPYTASWNGPDNFISNAQLIQNLEPGEYDLTVSDANGCSLRDTVLITEPDSLAAAATVTQAGCTANDGAIDATVTGGTTPYTFAWTGPAGYTAGTEDISALAPGSYSLTITDANNCTAALNNISITTPQYNSYALSIAADTIFPCANQAAAFSFTAVNNGIQASDAAAEKIVVELPTGIVLQNNAIVAVHNAPAAASLTVTSLPGGGSRYAWTMPAGVNPGDSIQFTATLEPAAGSTPPCGDPAIIAYVANPCCTTSNCTTSRDSATVHIERFRITATGITGTYASGTVNGTVTLQNTGGVGLSASDQLSVGVYVDMNDNGLFDPGTDEQIGSDLQVTGPLAAGASTTIPYDLSDVPAGVNNKNVLGVVRASNCVCQQSVAVSQIPLPVTMKDFSVQNTACTDILNWETTAEVNVSRMELERSWDGRQFSALAIVQLKGSQGGGASYTYTDKELTEGIYYYRLKLVDQDGKTDYSVIVNARVKGCGAKEIRVYPNPLTEGEILNISLSNFAPGTYNVFLTDQSGKKLDKAESILVEQPGSVVYKRFYVNHLAQGIYYVQVLDDNGVIHVTKLFVH